MPDASWPATRRSIHFSRGGSYHSRQLRRPPLPFGSARQAISPACIRLCSHLLLRCSRSAAKKNDPRARLLASVSAEYLALSALWPTFNAGRTTEAYGAGHGSSATTTSPAAHRLAFSRTASNRLLSGPPPTAEFS